MGLFQPIPSADNAGDRTRPLADRMRPRTLEEFVGQEHLIGPGKPLRTQIERDDLGSLIFWVRRARVKLPWHRSSHVSRRRSSLSFPRSLLGLKKSSK